MTVDQNGTVVQKDDYYPFGLTFNHWNEPSVADENRYKYNGFEEQVETGLFDYLARYYDPAIGRFINVDPAAELMRRQSTYNYAFNNPIRFIDPDGMMPSDTTKTDDGGANDQTNEEPQEAFDQDPWLLTGKQTIENSYRGKGMGARAWFWFTVFLTLRGDTESPQARERSDASEFERLAIKKYEDLTTNERNRLWELQERFELDANGKAIRVTRKEVQNSVGEWVVRKFVKNAADLKRIADKFADGSIANFRLILDSSQDTIEYKGYVDEDF